MDLGRIDLGSADLGRADLERWMKVGSRKEGPTKKAVEQYRRKDLLYHRPNN